MTGRSRRGFGQITPLFRIIERVGKGGGTEDLDRKKNGGVGSGARNNGGGSPCHVPKVWARSDNVFDRAQAGLAPITGIPRAWLVSPKRTLNESPFVFLSRISPLIAKWIDDSQPFVELHPVLHILRP